MVATEEYQARLFTDEGVDAFIAHQQAETAKIKIHVKTGIAKCTRVEFECPKKYKPSAAGPTPPTRNIVADMNIRDFCYLIVEAEESESAAQDLLSNPRSFFEQRGWFAPPDVSFYITPSDELRGMLRTEPGINDFLDRQAAASFEVHVKEGVGKCTILTVECPK